MDKASLRLIAKRKRINISQSYRQDSDKIISQRVGELMKSFDVIAMFYPRKDEIQYLEKDWLAQDDKVLCFPRIEKAGKMSFYRVNSLEDFSAGPFGIREPNKDMQRVNPKEIELFIIPMLMFNRDNYRLGYGGGFYDRYLEGLRALKVGIAYDVMKTHVSFQTKNDVDCDYILTEGEVYEKKI